MKKKYVENNFIGLIKKYRPNHSDNLTVGEVIRSLRKNFGYTLAEIQAVTGISQSNLSLYENDKKKIGLVQAIKLGLALGIDPLAILFPNGYLQDPKYKEIARRGKKLRQSKEADLDLAHNA